VSKRPLPVARLLEAGMSAPSSELAIPAPPAAGAEAREHLAPIGPGAFEANQNSSRSVRRAAASFSDESQHVRTLRFRNMIPTLSGQSRVHLFGPRRDTQGLVTFLSMNAANSGV